LERGRQRLERLAVPFQGEARYTVAVHGERERHVSSRQDDRTARQVGNRLLLHGPLEALRIAEAGGAREIGEPDRHGAALALLALRAELACLPAKLLEPEIALEQIAAALVGLGQRQQPQRTHRILVPRAVDSLEQLG